MSIQTMAGAALAIVSFSLVLLSRYQLGKSFTFTPQARELMTHGIYSRVRNPMYVFVDLTLGGLSIATHRWWVLLPLVILVPAQIRNAGKERKLLEEKFGDRYRAYYRSTWF